VIPSTWLVSALSRAWFLAKRWHSRAILASALSRTQDLAAFQIVLFAAVRDFGSPEALVSDARSIFKAKGALRIYAELGTQKEQIEKRQTWQSYIETSFNI
jgi:hypothetical protein